MLSQLWLQHSQALQQLEQQVAHQEPITPADIVQVAQQWITWEQQAPEAFYAQLCLHVPVENAPGLCDQRALVTTLLLCRRRNWNSLCTLHLLCAAISLRLFAGKGLPASFQRRLTSTEQQLWLHSLVCALKLLPHRQKRSFSRLLERLSEPQQLLVLAFLLAEMLDANGSPFQQALRALSKKLPPRLLGLLEALFPFPGSFPPGSMVALPSGKGMVVAISDKGMIVRHQDAETGCFSQHPEIVEDVSKTAPLPQHPLSSVTELDSIWPMGWQDSLPAVTLLKANRKDHYPISQPPAKLLVIQDLLMHQDPDPDLVATHIAEEGFLAKQLNDAASRHSRLKLKVTEVKHALLFHGFERTSAIMIQQALLNRLNQHYFPLQESLLQFNELAAQCVENLAAAAAMPAPQSTRTMAYFCCSAFFTHGPVKILVKPPKRGNLAYDINQLLHIKEAQTLQQLALKLALAWQQDVDLLAGLRWHNQLPAQMACTDRQKKYACLLGLGLLISSRAYWGEETEVVRGEQYQYQALQQLGLNTLQLQEALWQAIDTTHCFCPC